MLAISDIQHYEYASDTGERTILMDQGSYSSLVDLAECLERLTANAKVATVLGSIPSYSDSVESERRHIKQCWIMYWKK